MGNIVFTSMVSAVALHGIIALGSAEEAPAVHDPAIHPGAGLKKELIAGITEADFLKLGDKPGMVKITLVIALNETNSWMNFNGYSHGKATYVIPAGWTVEVTVINPSPVPHSAIVVERQMVRKVQLGEPVFDGASTPHPITGMSTGKATFTFTASEPGEYAFACGIPMHAAGGHWVALDVSKSAKTPALRLGDAPPEEGK